MVHAIVRRRLLRAGAVVALLLAATQCFALPRLADRCFIVSVDGLAARYLSEVEAPNLRNLMRYGSWTLRAESVVPCTTLPATASMLSGLLPRRHGIDWDRWEPSRGTLRASTILTVTSASGGRPGMFLAHQKILHLVPPELREDAYVIGTDDVLMMDRVIRDFFTEQRTLWYIELGGVEEAGHAYGWGSPEYLQAIEVADYQIGRLLDAVAERDCSATSAMIVTSDHGGSGTRSDVPGPDTLTIPWVVCGPNIRANYQIAGRLRVYDTAATAAVILGLDPPTDWDGKPPLRVLGES